MAEPEENLSTDEKVERSVARTLGNALFALVVLGGIGVWLWLGCWYIVGPGQAAVLLVFGRHAGTVVEEGPHLSLPPPLVTREMVNVQEIRSEDFGLTSAPVAGAEVDPEKLHEATMQTSDNNIVLVSFAVQYQIKDAYAARYQVAEPAAVVRDAAQAAMRQVVGRMTVDGALRERRADLTKEASKLLQEVLDAYGAGLRVLAVELADVQPPDAVRAAFDDVDAAKQDASRLVNEAEGYRNEVIPGARAEAEELKQAAAGYKEAKVAEAEGEADRFTKLAKAFAEAPTVTRKRLYLETMEAVLPGVEKVIVEPGTAAVLPYLPLGRAAGEAEKR